MASLLLSRRDLDFLLHEWLEVEALTKRPRFADHSRETFDDVLDLAEQIATEHFATHNRLSDANEPVFDGEQVTLIPEIAHALEVFGQAGLLAGTLDEELGGLQLPAVVGQAVFGWFQAANVGTSSYPFLTIANANLLLAHGSPEQVETYVRPMVEGRFFGTMCLSEPQAGSSLSDVTTRAVPQDDGTYRLFGNKMWISAGDHELTENIVHLVLAKIPGGPAGVKGISLFVVPKTVVETGERNDVVLAGLNHKMGFRGTVNTLLNFGEAGLLAGTLDEELGGLQLPAVVGQAVFGWFQAANVGTSSYPFLTIGNANLLLEHGSPDLVERFVPPMVEGRFFGTMCLSEPQAGSSLADVSTRAEPQPDGTYRLFGNKMWISAGEHELSENIVHLVLARIPGSPPGVCTPSPKLSSVFVVPR